jgi:hypothetical protein
LQLSNSALETNEDPCLHKFAAADLLILNFEALLLWLLSLYGPSLATEAKIMARLDLEKVPVRNTYSGSSVVDQISGTGTFRY